MPRETVSIAIAEIWRSRFSAFSWSPANAAMLDVRHSATTEKHARGLSWFRRTGTSGEGESNRAAVFATDLRQASLMAAIVSHLIRGYNEGLVRRGAYS